MAPIRIDATDGNTHAPADNLQHRAHVEGSDSGPSVSEGHLAEPPLQVPIAICGMSTRLPGGLRSPQDLWDFVIGKNDARCLVPDTRYNIAAYYSDRPKPVSVKSKYGYFLDENTDYSAIDASFFNVTKLEAARIDPQQRQMLEVARECMDDAGETNWRGRAIGCYIGNFGQDWLEMSARDSQQYSPYRANIHDDSMLPNRISYEMNLMGPSIIVRTACSAALVALHEACVALSRGDCEGAIVGGVNIILGPGMTMAISDLDAISPDGSCKAFSADADGYARAEAISAIFIKPLAHALRDGNPVRAVIRGTATNSDGSGTGGIQVPNDIAQEAVIRRAYRVAGIHDLSETAFVECHGTGTPIGDPIEARAVGRVFGPSGGIQIGSVKANLGHSEGASGLTSLIKAVMALEHRTIPPNIKFNTPNPDIPWDSCKLSVPTESVPWPSHRRERISVNSFGIGGTNVHVVLDSALSHGVSPVPGRSFTSPELIVCSANNPESLQNTVSAHQMWVQGHLDRISDLAFTLANRREHFSHRAFAVVSPSGSLTASMPSKPDRPPHVFMVFTGQGAQWPQMGLCLLQSPIYPIFGKTIRLLDAHLQSLRPAPEWSIEDEIRKPARTSRLSSAEISQPLCTAIQIALLDMFASAGVRPATVVGHSSGEIAAAYAAGAISALQAITIAFYRGQVTSLQTQKGAMAAIGMSSEDVRRYLEPGVIVACQNSPTNVTVSGDAKAVKIVVSKIQEDQPDILAKLLQVDKAYHSHHMAEIGDRYHVLIEPEVSAIPPKTPFFSSVTGNELTSDTALDAAYWQRNLESPVLFHSAVASMIRHRTGNDLLLLEIGPHSALAGSLRQIQEQHSSSYPYISSLIRGENDVQSFLSAIGNLHCLHVPVDLSKVVTLGSCLRDLPRYPWDHRQKFWQESRLSKEWRHRKHAYHDLLGLRVVESSDFDVLFRNVFHLNNTPWISDHKIGENFVFPFAGYAGMIGEAIRQITNVNEAYVLRKVVISTALMLSEDHPVEITTSLRRCRLTDFLDSEWWYFTIASYNGTRWIKHCSGEVKAHRVCLEVSKAEVPLMRKLTARRCYDSMAQAGVNLGPSFQRLDDVRSDTINTTATSMVVSKKDDNLDYHMHPTVIDASLQLLATAASKGYVNTTDELMVPTSIEEMEIFQCAENVEIRSSASYTRNHGIVGGSQCVAEDGRVLLRSCGVNLSAVAAQELEHVEKTSRLEWGPDIDFLDTGTLIRPDEGRNIYMRRLDELAHLCIVHTKRTIGELNTPIEHMHKYRSWINHECQKEELESLVSLVSLDDETIDTRVNCIVNELSMTPAAYNAVALRKVYHNMERIFTGDVEVLDVLLEDNILATVYQLGEHVDEAQFFKHLTHSKPNLRVLEIGAGTGASTSKILKLLTSDRRDLYSKYTFTDISPGFFINARDKFSGYARIEYLPLDISQDPWQQGFDGCKYDLVIASNVIHATHCLKDSLCNIRKLLEPNGRLLLNEITQTIKWVNYVFGNLVGWWYGGSDGRPDQPYVDVERWTKELMAAGFCAPDAVIPDALPPHNISSIIVARPAIEIPPRKNVTLITTGDSENVACIMQCLEKRRYAIDRRQMHEPLPAGQDMIAMLDDDGPFFEEIGGQRFEMLKAFVGEIKGNGVLWVTGVSQMQCQDPRFAQIQGIARVMRSEMLIDFATCEVDNFHSSADRIIDVFEKFQMRQAHEVLKPECEYAIINNAIHIGRIYPFSIQSKQPLPQEQGWTTLQTTKPGRLSALQWVRRDMRPCKDGDVEVEIHAAGLNFKDVLISMGIVESFEDGFGLEAAGIVRRTGANITHVKAGDRVLLKGGIAATSQVVSGNYCAKIPSDLTFEDAATLPVVFSTAIYSVFMVGNLQRGQSILIHSACGGVGLATIQLAQMAGAKIYATVGNENKVDYLINTFGIPRNRIFNSRDASFVDGIMRETGDRGVDVALNSLSGELLHATWKCIAPFGTMVEIGKKDMIGSGKLDLQPFLANRRYCSVDLDQVFFSKPEVARDLLRRIIELLGEGHIRPIRPIRIFDSNCIVDAFRYMQQGNHIGKIVVSMRNEDGQIALGGPVAHEKKATRFDSSAAYLLAGGLGGLGRSVSRWMVERGARHLIYLSRSAGTTKEDLEFLAELQSMECRVDFVQGTVSRLDDVTQAINQAHGLLRGIFQMSMVLREQRFSLMKMEEWKAVVDPRVKGTWNLHNAAMSAKANLDFFVLFGSLSGTFGYPGQANYASTNTFMGAFAQYRMNMGLPASTVQIGIVDQVGYVAENQAILKQLSHIGQAKTTISEQELLEALEGAVNSTSANFYLGIRSNLSIGNTGQLSLVKRNIQMSLFDKGEEDESMAGSTSSGALKAFIIRAKGDPTLLTQAESAQFVAQEIGKEVFRLMLKPEEDLQTSYSLRDLGMDSLIAIELRRWWKSVFGFDINTFEILGMGSFDDLGKHATSSMLQLFQGVKS